MKRSKHSKRLRKNILRTTDQLVYQFILSKSKPLIFNFQDVLNQFELNLDYISYLNEWYIPINDLYNIYVDLYGKEMISKEVIFECSSLMYLARYIVYY